MMKVLHFSGQNLQGKSFQGQRLVGADFRGADIRSTDFTGADLTNSDFSNIVAGLDQKSSMILFFLSISVAAIAGAAAGLGGQYIERLFERSPYTSLTIAINTILVAVFLLVTFLQGLGPAIKSLISKIVFWSLVIGVLVIVTGVSNGFGVIGVILYLVLLTIVAVSGTIARTCAGTMSNILFFLVAISGMVVGRSFGAGLEAMAITISSVLISRRALSGDRRDAFVLRTTLVISSYFGTSFRQANLTNANFTNARLINTNFRQATLTRICWDRVQNLHLVVRDR